MNRVALLPSDHAESISYWSVTAGTEFDPGPVKVTLVIGEVTVGQALLQVIWLIFVSITQCYVPFMLLLSKGRLGEAWKLSNKTNLFQKSEELEIKLLFFLSVRFAFPDSLLM